MKYPPRILLALIMISNVIYSQWNVQYSNNFDDLACVHFVDYNNGWAVGGRIGVGALILKTTDGGTNWYDNLTVPNTINTFTSVYFTDQNTGWVIGYGGIMMKTSDAGISWDTINIQTSAALKQIQFIDSNYGWVAGGGIFLRTTDGGTNWETITGTSFNSICFIDQNIGWGVRHTIQKTTDGGLNWITQKDTTGLSIYFADELNGWCVGAEEIGPYGFIYNTTDSGNNWNRYLGLGQDIPSLQSVYFYDDNIGWAVGNGSSSPIIKTTDGGNSWFHQGSGPVNSLRSVFIIDSITGWTLGGAFTGYILKTTNGGISFIEEEVINEIPTQYYLSNNYPNPFNPSTKIRYSIPFSSKVTIKVFDVLGKEIETLVNEEKQTGTYELTWFAEGLPSGVYFYSIQAGSFIQTRKMILLK